MDRDRFMSPPEAQEYGIIDRVLEVGESRTGTRGSRWIRTSRIRAGSRIVSGSTRPGEVDPDWEEAMSVTSDKHLRCSFCGKSKDSVKKFISGPSVYICNECVSLCNEILAEEEEREAVEAQVPSPTPEEIKEILDQYVIGQERPSAPWR